MVTRRLKFD